MNDEGLGKIKEYLKERSVNLWKGLVKLCGGTPDDAVAVAHIVKCRGCNDIIQSKHRRDFVTCSCGAVSIDGGCSCPRILGDLSNVIRLPVYSDTPYEQIREVVYRGGRGELGDQPLQWVKLSEMDDNHILNTLKYMLNERQEDSLHYSFIMKEAKYRGLM